MFPYRQCKTKLGELLRQLEKSAAENKYSLEDTKAARQDVEELLQRYDKEARGPAKAHVLAKCIPKSLQKVLDSVARNGKERMGQLDSSYRQKIAGLEEKLGLNGQELERAKDSAKTAKAKAYICAENYFVAVKARIAAEAGGEE